MRYRDYIHTGITRQEIAEHGPSLFSNLESGLDKCNQLAVVSFSCPDARAISAVRYLRMCVLLLLMSK